MNFLLFTIAAASKPVPTRAPTNAARPLLYPLLLLSESASLAAAAACRAAARTRIIVDDGECGCHFLLFVALGLVMCGVRKPKTNQNLAVLKFFLRPSTEPVLLTKCSRCVLMMPIYCTWLEVSILPVEREKTPRHRFSTFIVRSTVEAGRA
jgi:hypothetical protein